ncbi:site-specific DNA-methyltransferase [Yersinia aldovae]|uniref:site-specific DNA-methyltransferase n=1 Tax=Yersinia aldovae TaxID=29483 RepID=UPI0011A9581A|nr:site-specific DNA-methyltransferase [Yersinia aldovae]
MTLQQLDLFHVQEAYTRAAEPLSNQELYKIVASMTNISESELNERAEIGLAKDKHSKIKRKIRWYQQTLKKLKLIQKVTGERGIWQLAGETKKDLHEALDDIRLVAYSTDLGLAIWSNSDTLFSALNEPIHLCVTSPPYPLRVERAYGNVNEDKWVDFITRTLEPIVKNLVPGGSVVLNISNDIFDSKSPSRSLYVERMVIALHDRLGLSLMDRWPWINLSKPPGPTRWACVNRYQLCSGWEPIYWFTNNPLKVRSDNRRVLQPHTEKHRQLIDKGGDLRIASYGGGTYRLRGNSFSAQTSGRIPKNVIHRGHRCADSIALKKKALALGLPPHPAMFPTDIPAFAIEFLTQPEELVVDPFSGSNKTGLAAERLGRRWLSCDRVLEYVRTQAEMFTQFEGYWLNPSMRVVGN